MAHAAKIPRLSDELLNLQAAVYVCDRDGVVVHCSKRAIELWGRTPSLGDPSERFCGSYRMYTTDGSLVPHAQCPMADVLRNGGAVRDQQVVFERPDGAQFLARLHIDALKDAAGETIGAIGIFEHVLAHESCGGETARSALGEPSARSLFDQVPTAVYLTDADGRVTFCNEAAVAFAGRRPVLGSDSWCVTWRLYRPDGTPLPHDQSPLAAALKEDRPVHGEEAVAERPDGTRVPFLAFSRPLHDAAGRLMGAINTLVDISTLGGARQAAERRVHEQAALYRYTDRLYRATSLQETYDAALDAIVTTLRCSRASILLVDGDGVMRFVACRGLSQAYMTAVEGHTPWRPGERYPDPVLISDIDATDESDALKATVKAEGIRGLAFIPLVRAGYVVGKFMTYYETPHVFSGAEVEIALTIARQLGFSVEQARAEEARTLAERKLAISENRFRAIIDQTTAGIAETDLTGRFLLVNDRYCEITGYSRDDLLRRTLQEITHPDDLPQNAELFTRLVDGGQALVMEKRYVTSNGDPIWVSKTVSLTYDAHGRPMRAVAIALDVSDRKRAEEQQRLLLREMSHRIKNVFAIVGSLVTLSASSSPGAKDFAKAAQGRIAALASAHDLTRPGLINPAGEQGKQTTLDALVRTILSPYGAAPQVDRVMIEGPAIPIGATAATNLALTLHELATNAAKYGALSTPTGSVAIDWVVEGNELHLTWRERGGPPIADVPEHKGFGSTVTRAAIGNHGGRLIHQWEPDGLVVHLTARIDRLAN